MKRFFFPSHAQSFSLNVTSKNNFLQILQGIGGKYTYTHTHTKVTYVFNVLHKLHYMAKSV